MAYCIIHELLYNVIIIVIILMGHPLLVVSLIILLCTMSYVCCGGKCHDRDYNSTLNLLAQALSNNLTKAISTIIIIIGDY